MRRLGLPLLFQERAEFTDVLAELLGRKLCHVYKLAEKEIKVQRRVLEPMPCLGRAELQFSQALHALARGKSLCPACEPLFSEALQLHSASNCPAE